MGPRDQLELLFHEAVESSVESQRRLIERLRRENPTLGRQLEALLAQDHCTEENLNPSIEGADVEALASELAEPIAFPRVGGPRRLGKYEVVHELGGGSMGVVYLANDTALHRPVALKVIRPEQLPFAAARARFRREMTSASRIDHPNVCPVFEAGESGGRPFLAMRYVEGVSLAAWLSSKHATMQASGKSSTDHARTEMNVLCDWFAALADGLHAVHQSGLVHRDVKPANILIGRDGVPVLVDFGLARAVEKADGPGLTATGALLGTPAYMAPEQIRVGEEVDRRADVYALGLTLRECLTLQPAFEADNREALYQEILSTELPPPRRVVHAIPEDLSLVVATATALDPADRYATAREFAADLRRVREFAPIVARRPPLWLRLRRWAQRHPAAASTMATSFVGLAVSLFLLHRSVRAETVSTSVNLMNEAVAMKGARPDAALQFAADALAANDSQEMVAQAQEVMHSLRYSRVLNLGGEPNFVRWSPDGRFLVAGGSNVDTTIFRANGKRNHQLPGTASPHQRALVAFMGDRLVVGASDGVTRVYELGDGSVYREFGEPGPATWCMAARDDAILVVRMAMSAGVVALVARLWQEDSEGFRDLELAPEVPASWLVGAFLPDGRIVAAGCLWSRDGRLIQTLDQLTGRMVPHIATAGRRIAFICYDEFRQYNSEFFDVFLYEVGPKLTPVRHRRFDVPDSRFAPRSAAMTPDGDRTLITFCDGRVVVLDLLGATVAAWRTYQDSLATHVDVAQDGRILVSNWSGRTELVDHRGKEILRLEGHDSGVIWAEFSPDGQSVATASWDGTVRIWDLRRMPSMQLFGLGWTDLDVCHASGRIVVAGEDGFLRVCNSQGETLETQNFGTGLAAATFHDATTILASGADGSVVEWDLASNQLRDLPNPGSELRVSAPQRLADGRLLLADINTQLMVAPKDRQDGWRVFSRPGQGTTAVRVSADGEFVAFAEFDNVLRVWNRHRKELHRFSVPGMVLAITFCDDHDLMAVACGDKFAHLWDLGGVERSSAERKLGSFGPHRHRVHDVALSPSGRRIATVSRDGTARVFDVASHKKLIEFRAHESIAQQVVFVTEDRLVTAGSDGYVRWWLLDADSVKGEIARHLARIKSR